LLLCIFFQYVNELFLT